MSSELIKSKQVLNTDSYSLHCSLQIEKVRDSRGFFCLSQNWAHALYPSGSTIQITTPPPNPELTAVTYYCSTPLPHKIMPHHIQKYYHLIQIHNTDGFQASSIKSWNNFPIFLSTSTVINDCSMTKSSVKGQDVCVVSWRCVHPVWCINPAICSV